MSARVLTLRRGSLAFVAFLVLGRLALGWADEDSPPRLREHISFEEFKDLAEREERSAILEDFKRTERLAEMERRGLLEAELMRTATLAVAVGDSPQTRTCKGGI